MKSRDSGISQEFTYSNPESRESKNAGKSHTLWINNGS